MAQLQYTDKFIEEKLERNTHIFIYYKEFLGRQNTSVEF
jgi:hypothetical protein